MLETTTTQNSPVKSVNLTLAPLYKENEKEIWTTSPEELVDSALHTLKQAEVQIIEWRTTLHRRMGVPVILTDYHYLIPDADLDKAMNIVSKTGIPLISPPPILPETTGDFYTLGHHFRLTRSSAISLLQMLVLFPSSFASFNDSELELKERFTSLSTPLCKTILVPRPPAVFSSILRTMVRCPRVSKTRLTLACDLSELIGYHIYEMYDGFVDVDDEEACERLQVDQKVEDGAAVVRTWLHNGGWRESEEWTLDVLYWIVVGQGEADCIPWAPS